MKQYLYGASVQGIQDYIFETNKLNEIIGASEMVEYISTALIKEVFQELGLTFIDDQVITLAAGNIKYVFDSQEDCQALVRIFPYKVASIAPGLSLSQAVVSYDKAAEEQGGMGNFISVLENKLKQQRNRQPVAHGLGLMISRRAPLTGRPGVGFGDDRGSGEPEIIDANQKAKIAFADKKKLYDKIIDKSQEGIRKHDFPALMDDIASQDDGNWIAVVHADGNNLGKKMLAIASKGAKPRHFRELSILLDKANTEAFAIALQKVVDEHLSKSEKNEKLPLRPVVLGGDDLTLIIRGDWAVDFTTAFLHAFEKATRELFRNFDFEEFHQGLTACAGIAFIKPSFPFHYGADLSEQLCSYAKDKSKQLNENHSPSSIMFHRVLSSFVDDNYQDLIQRELTVNMQDKNKTVSLANGPYFLHQGQDGYMSIGQLVHMVRSVQNNDAPRSRLRNWLTEFQNNPERAARTMDRIIKLYGPYKEKLQLGNPIHKVDDTEKTHLHDLITLSSIM
jgi:hypothetical protein